MLHAHTTTWFKPLATILKKGAGNLDSPSTAISCKCDGRISLTEETKIVIQTIIKQINKN